MTTVSVADRGFMPESRGWELNPPRNGEISRKSPLFLFSPLIGVSRAFKV
jgi:hypothetical protein